MNEILKQDLKVKNKLTSNDSNFIKHMYNEFENQLDEVINEEVMQFDTINKILNFLKSKRLQLSYTIELIDKELNTIRELNGGISKFINSPLIKNNTIIGKITFIENDKRLCVFIYKPTLYQLYKFFNLTI